MRCILIALLLFSLHFQSTPAAASPASSGKISALSPVFLQAMDTASGISQAKPRKLATGGGRSGGGGGGRSGGGRGFIPRTRAYGNSAAAPRSHCLGMTTLTVLATSLMAILHL